MNIQERLDIVRNGFTSCYKVIDEEGTERWFNKDHQLHRDNDLPAVIKSNGSKFWYKDGKLHRDNDLPAATYSDGRKEWFNNGVKFIL
jgi:hypothetical protein